MSKEFEYEPSEVFLNTTSYPDPESEADIREQLSRPLNQIKSFINELLLEDESVGAERIGNENVEIKDENGVVKILLSEQLKALRDIKVDGNNIKQIRINQTGLFEYTVDGDIWTEISKGNKGDPGPGIIEGGLAGQYLGKKTDESFDTEWRNFPIDSALSSESTNAVQNKIVYVELQKKANKSTIQNVTLLASNWVGDEAPYTYTLALSGVTSTSVQELLPSLDITSEQLEVLQGSNIQDGGQSTDQIILKAYGDKPEVDIPIRIIMRGDM